MNQIVDIIIIGGGAAGIFAAIQAKIAHPSLKVIVLEKTAVVLSKVRVSGGGRCNVTHACFDPPILVQNYPRGHKELLAPFYSFQPQDTIDWFESKGVQLKIEPDGRVFPISNSSETIISCLLTEAANLGVEIRLRQKIEDILYAREQFEILLEGHSLIAPRLLLATGSSKEGYRWAERLGHTIQPPVPSLFTFNVPSSPLRELSGIVINPVEVKLAGTHFTQQGPLLITHFGFSGPAILKLSAWGARHLYHKNYQTEITINWLPSLSQKELLNTLLSSPLNPFSLPKNFWKLMIAGLSRNSKKNLNLLSERLHADRYLIQGKTTHKEEFVTCGGISLQEINFKTMQSKCCPGLYFAGEILDIDGITGGFNFQNCWTNGSIFAKNL